MAGLIDHPPGRRPERLTDGEQAVLVHHILRGPDPDRGEPSSWTLPDLCRFIEARFGKTMLPQSMSRLVVRSRATARTLFMRCITERVGRRVHNRRLIGSTRSRGKPN
ncbi:helix-turn-helix domain-containing protein [Methylobacterium nodulans]|uniref:helix-turn-helix domain-containing protein n=1 Tax=Methylobacterium nodulans TaxID=114616 RepID=UPI00016194FB